MSRGPQGDDHDRYGDCWWCYRCVAWGDHDAEHCTTPTEAETEAKLCLIAAAPDLLDALKVCHHKLTWIANQQLDRRSEGVSRAVQRTISHVIDQALVSAKAAIAKAGGAS